jgi:hypothetical protein
MDSTKLAEIICQCGIGNGKKEMKKEQEKIKYQRDS